MPLPKEYSLVRMIKKYGKSIIGGIDFISALIITLIISYFYVPDLLMTEDNLVLILTLIGSNAGLLGIVLAGFSIFIAFIDEKFLLELRKAGFYEDTVFLFTYSALLISIGLISSMLFAFLYTFDDFMAATLFIGAIFFTFYGLLSVVFLFIQVKNISISKSRYVASDNDELTEEDF